MSAFRLLCAVIIAGIVTGCGTVPSVDAYRSIAASGWTRSDLPEAARSVVFIAVWRSPDLPGVRDGSLLEHGLGSGVIVGSRAALTALHVVEEAKMIVLFTKDGGVHVAEIAWKGKRLDLAVLRVGEALPPPIRLRLQPPAVGENVTVIGHPANGDAWTVTSGEVTSVTWPLADDPLPFFATTARGGAGTSGGAILDADENLVGIVVLRTLATDLVIGRSIQLFCEAYKRCAEDFNK